MFNCLLGDEIFNPHVPISVLRSCVWHPPEKNTSFPLMLLPVINISTVSVMFFGVQILLEELMLIL